MIDGSDLTDLTIDSRTDAIALIPQDGFLFNGTLRANLTYGAPDASESDVWNVLRAMGIDDWVRNLPDGLDTEVRERGGRFSAGERQLVALGRAFLDDPSVIVLDEATSNLDPETEVEIEGALRVLLAGRTAIVIAHRLRSAERADRVIMIGDGRIIADGTHAELVESSTEYRRLVEVWERGTEVNDGYLSEFEEQGGYLNFASVGPASKSARTASARLLDADGGLATGRFRTSSNRPIRTLARRSPLRSVLMIDSRPRFRRPAQESCRSPSVSSEPEGNIVVPSHEFPANRYPWLRAEAAGGPEVRSVEVADGRVVPEALARGDRRRDPTSSP